MIVYILGIPLVSVLELFRHRKKLWDPNFPEIKRMYGSLFIYYKPQFWWFECVESLKKMALAGGMVIVASGSSLQLLIAIIISLLYLVVILDNHPYDDPKDQKLQMYATIQMIMTLIMGLILKVDASQSPQDQVVIGYVLVFINGSVIVMAGLAVLASLPSCASEEKLARRTILENGILQKSVKVLEEVPPATVKTILNRMTFKKVKPGVTLAKAGSNQEPICILIFDGHVGVYDINGKYKTNLGGGRMIGENMFSLDYGETMSRTSTFQTLTNTKIFVLNIC